MKLGKNGMSAIMDALIFITIIGLVASGVYAYSNVNEKGIDSESVFREFFDVKLKTEDIFYDTDTQNAHMADLLAAHMISKKGDVIGYVKEVLSGLVPPIYGYTLDLDFKGKAIRIGDGSGTPSSSFASDIQITGGGVMKAVITIY